MIDDRFAVCAALAVALVGCAKQKDPCPEEVGRLRAAGEDLTEIRVDEAKRSCPASVDEIERISMDARAARDRTKTRLIRETAEHRRKHREKLLAAAPKQLAALGAWAAELEKGERPAARCEKGGENAGTCTLEEPREGATLSATWPEKKPEALRMHATFVGGFAVPCSAFGEAKELAKRTMPVRELRTVEKRKQAQAVHCAITGGELRDFESVVLSSEDETVVQLFTKAYLAEHPELARSLATTPAEKHLPVPPSPTK